MLQKKEEFFTCAWAPVFCLADSETPSLCDAIDDVSAPLVAVGGERGLIRIIDPAQKRVYQVRYRSFPGILLALIL